MICKDGVSPNTPEEANDMIDMNTCAEYYLKSREVLRRCLPHPIDPDSQVLQDVLNMSTEALKNLLVGQSNINIFMQAKEVGQRVVQDLSSSWPFVVGGLAIAMVVCLIYIVLMRWFAGIMVWFSLLGTIAVLAYCVYATYMKYDELKRAEEKARDEGSVSRPEPRVTESAENELNRILEMKDTWLVFLIISAVALAIVVLLVIFLRNRIRIAVALIKEASKAVSSITSTLIFPLFPWLLQLLVFGWFVSVLVFLAGSTHPVYKAIMDNCNCTTNSSAYEDGGVCNPSTFEECLNNCSASCMLQSHEKEQYIDYLHALNIFGVFWGLFFVSALGQMILAGTFATWYWTFNKSDVPFFTVTISTGRTFRYHLGTLAFGSLILAICRIIRVILEYINHKLSKYHNACVKAIMCCLRCFFWCLEKFIKFINKNAYIMCAIYGKNFCRSAYHAFNLLMRNILRVFVLDRVTDFLLFMGKLMITAGMCALAFYVLTDELPDEYLQVPVLNYTVVPILIIGFGTYFIAGIFFGVYSMAVDTLFLCFLEDIERNDGSPEKPYFMSRELMKILNKKNE
jgi:choline transporter-like protein 2/4/5